MASFYELSPLSVEISRLAK